MERTQTTTTNAIPAREITPREWVTPTFEQVPLKAALSGTGGFSFDDFISYAS